MVKENVFDGKPSRQLDHRPFFSIVVACYNSIGTLERLLASIENQHMNDDIEVILSDDCSTESYQSVVERYNDRLCIKQIQTDYNFAPGNTREKGCSIVEGEWLCFADHDDEFVPDTLSLIRRDIEEHGERFHVVANFDEIDMRSGEVYNKMIATRNWCHAKFYNVDNLWRAYDIHFKKDLKTHEDIYVSSCIMCTLSMINGDKPLYSDVFCYHWLANPESISRTKYNDTDFTENFFDDYITATGRSTLEFYLTGRVQYTYAVSKFFDFMLFCYFYIQRFKYRRPKDYVKKNIDITRGIYKQAKEIFGFSNLDLIERISLGDAEWYIAVRESAARGVGPCVETDSLKGFLDILDPDPREDFRIIDRTLFKY